MFKRLSLFFGILVIVAAGGFAGWFLKGPYIVPVLMYHSVRPGATTQTWLAVTPQTFERQMRFLREHKYAVLPLEDILLSFKQKKKLPPKAIAITFDDGYKDNFLYAFPILKKYSIPAAVFIITQEVGRPQNDRLSWNEVKVLSDSGLVTIGSHAVGPEPLVNLRTQEELVREIFGSKRWIEEKLGRTPYFFSYPEGLFNDKIRQLVIDAGYAGAVATKPGRAYPDNDSFAIKRIRISENAANMFIFAAETSGYYTAFLENKKKRKRGTKR